MQVDPGHEFWPLRASAQRAYAFTRNSRGGGPPQIAARIHLSIPANVRTFGMVRIRPPVGADAEVVVFVTAGWDNLFIDDRKRANCESLARVVIEFFKSGS